MDYKLGFVGCKIRKIRKKDCLRKAKVCSILQKSNTLLREIEIKRYFSCVFLNVLLLFDSYIVIF